MDKLEIEQKESTEYNRAKLYKDGVLWQTGKADVSKDAVSFFPDKFQHLEGAIQEKITLEINGQILTLKQSDSDLELSSDRHWFFEPA